MLFVGFEPAFGRWGEDDPPVVPVRVQLLDNSYFVNELALARTGKMTEDAEPPGRSCGEIDPRTVPLIVGSTPGQIVGAVQQFAYLLEGARAGRLAAQLECRDSAGTALTEAACLFMLAHYRAERIHVVYNVPGCGRQATDAWCQRIETSLDDDTSRLEIIFETPRGDDPDIPPSRIRIGPVPEDQSSVG